MFVGTSGFRNDEVRRASGRATWRAIPSMESFESSGFSRLKMSREDEKRYSEGAKLNLYL